MRPAGLSLYLVLAAGQFALVTSVFMLTGALQGLAGAFGVSVGHAALAISVFSAAYAIATPFLAAAVAGCSAKVILIGSLLVFAAACLASPLVEDFRLLLALRVVAAGADGLYAATATAVAAALAPQGRKGRLLAVVNGGVTLAFVAGVPLASLLARAHGWPSMFHLVAGLALAAALGVALRLPRAEAPPHTPLRARLGVLLRPGMAPTLAVTAISYAGLFTVYNFTQPLIAALGLAAVVGPAGLLLAFGLATIVGNLVGGALADRFGVGWVVSLSLGGLAALLALMPAIAGSREGAFAFYAGLGLLHYLALTPIQHRIVELAGPHAGVGLALNASATYVGVAIAAQVGGWLVDHLADVASLGWAGAGLKLAGLGLFLLSLRVAAAADAPPARPVSRAETSGLQAVPEANRRA